MTQTLYAYLIQGKKLNFGFESGKFYVEHTSCSRLPGTLREESDRRAVELYSQNNKLLLCLSSGLDSQTALVSFIRQGIPIDCAFLRLNGYNDNEYENLKLLEAKYNFKTEIVNIDPIATKEEILDLSEQLEVTVNHALHYKFVSMLSKEHDVIQVMHDPWFFTSRKRNRHYVYHSWTDPEIARYVPLTKLPRQGNIQMFGDSTELFLSSITDPVFEYFFTSWKYFDNDLSYRGKQLKDVLRYDFYIKPLLYAKHWGDELIYFPKFGGYENVPWMYKMLNNSEPSRMCFIERDELIQHLRACDGTTRRYYENQPY
jgi:hypothetical protein